MMQSKIDAVVIGGGIAGLVSAAYLAGQGRNVQLFEQSSTLGGRARTKEKEGFHFNLGPHALYRSKVEMDILNDLGIKLRGKEPSTAGAFAVRQGQKYAFPAGPISLLTTGLFKFSTRLEVGRILASLPKIDGNTVMNVTLREWVENNISSSSAREFFLALFRLSTYVNAPDLMSAGVAIEQLKMALKSNVLYLDGGWQTIIDGLREAAIERGVVIKTGSKVDMIERNQDGSVRGVRFADGQSIETPVAIIAASPSIAASIVEGGRSTSLARLADESIAARAACLDLALKRLPNPKATFALGLDLPLYLSVHSASAKLAPEGGALIHLAKYLSIDHNQSPESVEREMEDLMDTVQPGWREVIVYRRFMPDMVAMNRIPSVSDSGIEKRPGPEVPDVAGLYLAGDWVGSYGLLADASFASAKQAAEMAVAYNPAKVMASAL
jgi:phytoene dehydrogenase-like protein